MKQLSFIEDMETQSPTTLLDCLKDHIDTKELIPFSVYRHYYKDNGRKHKYSLTSYINALLVQKLFSITQDNLLITLLNLSKELSDIFSEEQDFLQYENLLRRKTRFISAFANNTDRDAPFDIISDLNKIDEILFGDHANVPETSYSKVKYIENKNYQSQNQLM